MKWCEMCFADLTCVLWWIWVGCCFWCLQREKKKSKEAAAEKEARTMAHNTAYQIMDTGSTLRDLSLTAEPLFDVVFRIPEASLKLSRDDRQAGLYYMKQREQMMQEGSGVVTIKPKRFLVLYLPSFLTRVPLAAILHSLFGIYRRFGESKSVTW